MTRESQVCYLKEVTRIVRGNLVELRQEVRRNQYHQKGLPLFLSAEEVLHSKIE